MTITLEENFLKLSGNEIKVDQNKNKWTKEIWKNNRSKREDCFANSRH